MPCSVLFRDKDGNQRWYRAEILKILDKLDVEIRYVDLGFDQITNLFSLRHLKNEYMKFSVDVRTIKSVKNQLN